MVEDLHSGHAAEPERQGFLHVGTIPFLVVTFGSAWTLMLALFIATRLGHTNPMLRMGLLGLSMFGPALGAVVAQRRRGESVLAPLGVLMKPNRWWIIPGLAWRS